MDRYLRWLVSALVAGLLAAIVVNAFVDPYGLLGTPTAVGWTTPKTEIHHHSRRVTAEQICRVAPAAIALGASDVALGINPSHPGWSARPALNIGILGANIHEMRRYFEHALARGRLREVVLSVDLSAFDENLKDRADFDESRLGVPGVSRDACSRDVRAWTDLASIDTLYSSVATLAKNLTGRATWFATPDGMWHWRNEARAVRAHGGPAGVFSEVVHGNVEENFIPPWRDSFRLADGRTPGSRFDELRAIIEACLRHGVDLRIVLGPVHALIVETRRAAGVRADAERWVRTIVEIAAEESVKHPDAAAIAVWDFGGYNSITTEEIPQAGDASPMRWYVDAVHYRREVGDLILDRVFGVETSARPVPGDFGIRLTPENVAGHLDAMQAAGALYRASHPREIAAIEAVVYRASDRRLARGLGAPASNWPPGT